MPFLVNFKMCLHADEKPYCIEEACSNTQVQYVRTRSPVIRPYCWLCSDWLISSGAPHAWLLHARRFLRKELEDISCCRMRPTKPLLLRLMPQRRALVNTENAKSPTVSTRPLQSRIWLLPFGTLGDFAPKCQPQKKNNQWMNRLDDSVHSFETFQSGRTSRWTNTHRPRSGAAVAALNVISEHLMGSSLDGSTCHWPQFCPRKSGSGGIYCGVELKKTQKKSQTASPSAMQFTTPAAKLLI